MVDKKNVVNNIKTLLGDFFYEMYAQYKTDGVDGEKLSARIFNAILISCQILDDLDSARDFASELIEKNREDTISFYNNPDFVLPRLVSKYSDISPEEIKERLKHGFAVHFTTPNIAKKIENSGVLSSNNRLFPREIEELIYKAGKIQSSLGNPQSGLSLGFGVGRGISVSSQTCGFWMYHTPESLAFLFGGFASKRDKEGAIEYVNKGMSTLDDDLRSRILIELSKIWDDLIGEDKNVAAVLVDRDGIEYEIVTHWNNVPPLVEELRPFRLSLMDIISSEDSRITNDISTDHLAFLTVPSIEMLDEYKKKKGSQMNM